MDAISLGFALMIRFSRSVSLKSRENNGRTREKRKIHRTGFFIIASALSKPAVLRTVKRRPIYK
jgi:hypothetical protein